MKYDLYSVRERLIGIHGWVLLGAQPPDLSEILLYKQGVSLRLLLDNTGFPSATLEGGTRKKRKARLVGPYVSRAKWENKWANSLDMQSSEYFTKGSPFLDVDIERSENDEDSDENSSNSLVFREQNSSATVPQFQKI